MSQKKQLTIKEFSRLTGIKRENLRFYDRIGLLSPEMRGDNNYRYYSRRQLNMAYLIGDLRGLGVGIEDIKKYAACRTPENTLALFAQQNLRIQDEIRQLRETSRIMRIHSDMIQEALAHGEEALFLEEKKREPIFLCPPIPDGMNDEEAGIFSYDYAESSGIRLGIPSGTFVSQEQLESEYVTSSYRCYFKVGSGGNACKPSGLYAVTYGQCDSWIVEPVYRRLLEFIRARGLHICGDGYEEYPYGVSGGLDTDRNFIRVEIPVAYDNAENQ